MIKQIANINNLGQFENFESYDELGKNNIIFGFNGAGKSTLSDLFYSMMNGKDESFLNRRIRLNKEGEEEQKKIYMEIIGENQQKYIYSDNVWNNKPDNVFVFNEQYVAEHVFVSRQIHGDIMPIAIGKEGSRLMKKRDSAIKESLDLVKQMNEEIVRISDSGIKIKDFTSAKLTSRTSVKRFEKMSSFQLFPLLEKNKIQQKINDNAKYSNELNIIDKCMELYTEINNVQTLSIANIFKKIEKVPRISSKQIAEFLKNSLSSIDIKWAVKGYTLQKHKNICPMCGQEIRDKNAIEFFNRLGEYINQNKGEKVQNFSNELYQMAASLKNIDIQNKIDIFVEIVQKLDDNKLLLKKDINRLQKGLSWKEYNTCILDEVINKIYSKADNPYCDIVLSQDEKNVISILNSVIKNIKVLGNIIEESRNRIENKNEKYLQNEYDGNLFKLSYGSFRQSAENIKKMSSEYLKMVSRINELNQNLDDCYNQSRLNSVNDFLKKLNTHIKIEVIHDKYYIKLKDFKAKELLEGKETIFSEGEHRAIALAYFLAEISDEEHLDEKKIIIVDDPISSMDLSRKSIISYNIAEMMNNEMWQIILMTHDIGFVERVVSYLETKTTCKLMELRSEKTDFMPLCIKDYLTDDREVYYNFIKNAETDSSELSKIVALMSLRPYAYVSKISHEDFENVVRSSTYFAHTLYSQKGKIKIKEEDYSNEKLKVYMNSVNELTNSDFDVSKIVGDYSFQGFDFGKIAELYSSVTID